MTTAADPLDPTDGDASPILARLPEPIRLEDTVVSVSDGTTSPGPGGEPNAFIAAAVNAGG